MKEGDPIEFTKKMKSAVHRIVVSAQSYDPMLAGEIPIDDGVIVTDGFTLVHSPGSFGEVRCLCNNYFHVGGVLLDKLNTVSSVERILVEKPFRLEKVAGMLRKLCRQHSTTNDYDQSYITINGATFNTKHIVNAYEAVGSKACGYIASNPEVFYGRQYLVFEPSGFEYGKDVRAILLQSGRCVG